MFRSNGSINYLRSLLGLGGKKKAVQKPSSFFKNTRVQLEALEDRLAPTTSPVFVDDDWAGFLDGSQVDTDPNTAGLQAGTIGTNAFATIPAALAQVNTDGNGSVTLLSGNYPAAFALPSAFKVNLNVVANGSASVSGVISGGGSFGLNVGLPSPPNNGTLTLSGTSPNTYTGGTTVSRGVLAFSDDFQLGSTVGGSALVTVNQPGELQVVGSGSTVSSRTFTLNNLSNLRVAGGKTLALDGAGVFGGTFVGNGLIETVGSAPTTFSGNSNFGTIRAKSATTFTSFSNSGSIELAALPLGQFHTLSQFTNVSASANLTILGQANVSFFTSNGIVTIGTTGFLKNVGTTSITFGGGSNTTIFGPVPTSLSVANAGGRLDYGPADLLLNAGFMVNYGRVDPPGGVPPGPSGPADPSPTTYDLVVNLGGKAIGNGFYLSP